MTTLGFTLSDAMAPTAFLTKPDLLDHLNVPVEPNAPLGARTWYRCGGHAALLAKPATTAQLSALIELCNDQMVPVYVMGGGANLLVRDSGVDGVVVRLDDDAFKQIRIEGTTLTAGPGVDLFTLVSATCKAGLSGLAHIAGIPGTVGGAVRMNAGGAYGDIGESVSRVQLMSAEGQVYYRDRDDLSFAYRRTNIVAPFILDVSFELAEDDPAELNQRMREIFMFKKTSQPMGDKSAGCTFKNPPRDVAPPAGKLIDEAGLKGRTVGQASVSEVHANFIVAEPGCAADDVIRLMDEVSSEVRDKFDVSLEREVVVWP
ncbi:MAG: UDP-N-acetylmuramate dehydrogenase [Planctomycetota bacterium]